MAVSIAGPRAELQEAPPRDFDVSHFHGCPRRAKQILGWTPRIPLCEGLTRLVDDFRAAPSPRGGVVESS
jgi:nucleoside-diphosphate-sugar epimerase